MKNTKFFEFGTNHKKFSEKTKDRIGERALGGQGVYGEKTKNFTDKQMNKFLDDEEEFEDELDKYYDGGYEDEGEEEEDHE